MFGLDWIGTGSLEVQILDPLPLVSLLRDICGEMGIFVPMYEHREVGSDVDFTLNIPEKQHSIMKIVNSTTENNNVVQ